jgi:hypothetical protein
MRKKPLSSGQTSENATLERFSGESRPVKRKLFTDEEEEDLYRFLRGGLCAK